VPASSDVPTAGEGGRDPRLRILPVRGSLMRQGVFFSWFVIPPLGRSLFRTAFEKFIFCPASSPSVPPAESQLGELLSTFYTTLSLSNPPPISPSSLFSPQRLKNIPAVLGSVFFPLLYVDRLLPLPSLKR